MMDFGGAEISTSYHYRSVSIHIAVMKQLCGLKTEQKNLRSILRITCDDNDQDLANRINETFISIMNSYSALPEDLCFPNDN